MPGPIEPIAMKVMLAAVSLGAASNAMAQSAPGNAPAEIAQNKTPGTNRPSGASVPVIGAPSGLAIAGAGAPGPAATASQPPVRLGDFVITPSITAGAYFDDNVFAANIGKRSDVAFFARPEFTALAQGADYGVLANAYIEGRKYRRYSSEDQVNGRAAISGVYQPDAETQVRASAQYLHGNEDRGVSDFVVGGFDRPVAYDQLDGAIALNKRHGRFFTSIGGSALGVIYHDAKIGGVKVDESFRNVLISTATGRAGYVIAPLTGLFAEVTGNRRDFHFDGLTSSGFRAVAGLLFEPGPGARVKGEFYAGYMYQDYVGATFRTVSTWTYGGSIGFLLANNLTFTAEGRREAKESTLFGGVSVIESSVGGRFDVQLTDRLLLGAGATYLVNDYQGVGRSDHYLSPLASLRFTVDKNITLGLDYRYLEYRPSPAVTPAISYNRNVVMASINARF